jgi:hypothetical protein
VTSPLAGARGVSTSKGPHEQGVTAMLQALFMAIVSGLFGAWYGHEQGTNEPVVILAVIDNRQGVKGSSGPMGTNDGIIPG